MTLFIFPFGGIFGTVLAILVILYLIKYVTKRLQVTEKQINNDLKNFREELDKRAEILIPWNNEDLELLSLNLMEKKRSSGRHVVEKGIIKNVYQEPSLAYIVKHYKGKVPKSLMVARGHDFEMVWVRNDQGVTIYKNQTHIGNITRDGKYLNANGSKLIGELRKSAGDDLLVSLGDQLIASIKRNVDEDAVNPRAIELIGHPDQEHKDAILALSLMDIVEVARKG